jgi:hypothetical protein
LSIGNVKLIRHIIVDDIVFDDIACDARILKPNTTARPSGRRVVVNGIVVNLVVVWISSIFGPTKYPAAVAADCGITVNEILLYRIIMGTIV